MSCVRVTIVSVFFLAPALLVPAPSGVLAGEPGENPIVEFLSRPVKESPRTPAEYRRAIVHEQAELQRISRELQEVAAERRSLLEEIASLQRIRREAGTRSERRSLGEEIDEVSAEHDAVSARYSELFDELRQRRERLIRLRRELNALPEERSSSTISNRRRAPRVAVRVEFPHRRRANAVSVRGAVAY